MELARLATTPSSPRPRTLFDERVQINRKMLIQDDRRSEGLGRCAELQLARLSEQVIAWGDCFSFSRAFLLLDLVRLAALRQSAD